MSYLFAFSYSLWGSQGKNTEWFAIPFSSGPHSVSTNKASGDRIPVELFQILKDEDKRLVEASWWDGLAVGKTGSCSGGQAMLIKSVIQFSADGYSCVPSL